MKTLAIFTILLLLPVLSFAGGLELERSKANANYAARRAATTAQRNVPAGLLRTVEDITTLANVKWYQSLQRTCETDVAYYGQSDATAGMMGGASQVLGKGLLKGMPALPSTPTMLRYDYAKAMSGLADRDKINGLCSQSIPGSQYNFFSKTGEITYGSTKLSVENGKVWSFSSRGKVLVTGTTTNKFNPVEWIVSVQDLNGGVMGQKVEFRFNLVTKQWVVNDANLSITASRKSGTGRSWEYAEISQSDDPARETKSDGVDLSANIVMEKISRYYNQGLINNYSLLEFASALITSPQLREKVIASP